MVTSLISLQSKLTVQDTELHLTILAASATPGGIPGIPPGKLGKLGMSDPSSPGGGVFGLALKPQQI